CGCRVMRPLDAAAAGDYIMEPQHLAWQAASRGRAKKPLIQPRPVLPARATARVSISPKITADLLPVSGKAPLEVQHVVGDLERQPEQVVDATEAVEVPVAAIGDEHAPIRIG